VPQIEGREESSPRSPGTQPLRKRYAADSCIPRVKTEQATGNVDGDGIQPGKVCSGSFMAAVALVFVHLAPVADLHD
jgi:hypothetical protein